jgi:hypothetical protein
LEKKKEESVFLDSNEMEKILAEVFLRVRKIK